MKKIFLTLLLLNICSVSAIELPNDITEYLNKPYIGMEYEQALQQDLPFLLIFASAKDLPLAIRFYSIGEMVYNEFKNQYNFCILNKNTEEKEELKKFFNVTKEPALFIIDTHERTYTLIDKKYYKKQDLKKILTKFKDGTLFAPSSN